MVGRPLKKIEKKLVNVSTPRPPICTSMARTLRPRGVKVAGTSTVVSPVMLTALVATKRESTKEMPFVVQRGSIRTSVPLRMKNRKLEASISEGLVRRPGSFISAADRSTIE